LDLYFDQPSSLNSSKEKIISSFGSKVSASRNMGTRVNALGTYLDLVFGTAFRMRNFEDEKELDG
jgi:hypothetical protein